MCENGSLAPGMVKHIKLLFVSFDSGHQGKTSIIPACILLKELKKVVGPDPASPFKN